MITVRQRLEDVEHLAGTLPLHGKGRRFKSGPAHHCSGSHLRTSYSRKRRLAAHSGPHLSTDDFGARSPYKYLLDDPDFRRFIQNIRRRSEDSATETLRRFGMIDKRFHKLPKYFTRMNTKLAKKFLLDMIDDFKSKGGEDGGDLAGSYIQNYVKSINRWLEYNEITPPKKINVEGAEDSIRYENERPPTPEQLKVLLEHADLRARTAISIIAFAGPRIESLGKRIYPGCLDGLEIQDFPEIAINGDKVEFQEVPTLVVVRKPISKIHRKYTTFLCDEGCSNLKNIWSI